MKGHMYEPLMMNFKAIWIGKAFGSSQKGAEFLGGYAGYMYVQEYLEFKRWTREEGGK